MVSWLAGTVHNNFTLYAIHIWNVAWGGGHCPTWKGPNVFQVSNVFTTIQKGPPSEQWLFVLPYLHVLFGLMGSRYGSHDINIVWRYFNTFYTWERYSPVSRSDSDINMDASTFFWRLHKLSARGFDKCRKVHIFHTPKLKWINVSFCCNQVDTFLTVFTPLGC